MKHVMQGKSPGPSSKGFTLVEVMVAMGVILVLIGVAQASLFGVQRQRRAVTAKNNFIGQVRLAQANALLLGSASGTPRVSSPPPGQPGACPVAFEDPFTGGFRAGIQVDMNDIAGGWNLNMPSDTPGHSVTFVTDVVRQFAPALNGVPQPPTYEIRCKTFSYPEAYRNAVIFNRSLAEGLVGNRLNITFDSRGFISATGPGALNDGVISVPMREHEEGQTLAITNRDENILIFPSGVACIEAGREPEFVGRCNT
ncbi:MAG: type II secretion system protein [Myxococcota bacterium]|nr:type II secretion system protein [Myxococcota bacterium]